MAVIQPAALVMLLGAFAYASTMIATKRLAGHDSAFAILFYMAVIQLPLGLIPALPQWSGRACAICPGARAGRGGAVGSLLHDARLPHRRRDGGGADRFPEIALIAVVGAVFYNEPLELAIMVAQR